MSLLRGAFSGDEQDGPLYKCRLLLAEDPAFGAKPRPECSAKFFLGRTHCVHSFSLVSIFLPRFIAWPLELGLGTHNPRFVALPLELGLGTHNPRFVGWRESEATTCGAERSRPLKSVGKRNKKRRDEAQRELRSKRARRDSSSSSSSEGELFKDL